MPIVLPPWTAAICDPNKDVVFLLDRSLRFVDCNPAWDEFAQTNGGEHVSRSDVVGRYIFDFIPTVLANFYDRKYQTTWNSNCPTTFNYDCSSPQRIRVFTMTLLGVPEGMLVMNRLQLQESVPCPIPLNGDRVPLYLSDIGMVTVCANCRRTKRIDLPDAWDWLPETLQDQRRQVSHGLCPRCIEHVYGPLV
jgi:hypothetical protein